MGGLAPHFFVFDFFTNLHFDFSKNLLEVLRFFLSYIIVSAFVINFIDIALYR